MPQEQLWAPWRLPYIVSAKRPKAEDGCFLCRYRDEQDDASNLVVLRGERSLAVLNRFPYNNGHLLIAPTAHKAGLDELDDAELLGCMRQVTQLVSALQKVLGPDGFNVGLNLGRAAGAGLPGHLHWHVVPRWSGDTNFMPVLADVNVIPQSLAALHELLTVHLRSRNGS
ncbi:MAG: HIT domain-containing protein [Planctomycetales bacterium]